MAIKQPGSQLVLAVCKNGRRHHNLITGNPADGMPAHIELGVDVFNHNSPATIGGRQWHADPQVKTPLPQIGRINA
jgi:hypothetical protein